MSPCSAIYCTREPGQGLSAFGASAFSSVKGGDVHLDDDYADSHLNIRSPLGSQVWSPLLGAPYVIPTVLPGEQDLSLSHPTTCRPAAPRPGNGHPGLGVRSLWFSAASPSRGRSACQRVWSCCRGVAVWGGVGEPKVWGGVGEPKVTPAAGQGRPVGRNLAEGRWDPNSHLCSAPSCRGGLGWSLGVERGLPRL